MSRQGYCGTEEHLLHLLRIHVHPRPLLVVRPHIVEHELPVIAEVRDALIVIGAYSLVQRREGDRMCDELVVVWIVLYVIHTP